MMSSHTIRVSSHERESPTSSDSCFKRCASWCEMNQERVRTTRIVLCVVFNLAAFGCLLPGLTYPLLTVSVHLGETELFGTTRSILGTIRFLHQEGADLPAGLILIFSVFVPFMKFVLLLIIAFWYSNYWRKSLFLFVKNWSKWSMADVFVTAVFVAFLSANAAPATMAATVGKGFYCFLSYCLLSLVALQLMPKPKTHGHSDYYRTHEKSHHVLSPPDSLQPSPRSTLELENTNVVEDAAGTGTMEERESESLRPNKTTPKNLRSSNDEEKQLPISPVTNPNTPITTITAQSQPNYSMLRELEKAAANKARTEV